MGPLIVASFLHIFPLGNCTNSHLGDGVKKLFLIGCSLLWFVSCGTVNTAGEDQGSGDNPSPDDPDAVFMEMESSGNLSVPLAFFGEGTALGTESLRLDIPVPASVVNLTASGKAADDPAGAMESIALLLPADVRMTTLFGRPAVSFAPPWVTEVGLTFDANGLILTDSAEIAVAVKEKVGRGGIWIVEKVQRVLLRHLLKLLRDREERLAEELRQMPAAPEEPVDPSDPPAEDLPSPSDPPAPDEEQTEASSDEESQAVDDEGCQRGKAPDRHNREDDRRSVHAGGHPSCAARGDHRAQHSE